MTKTLREKSPIAPCVSVTKPIATISEMRDGDERPERVA